MAQQRNWTRDLLDSRLDARLVGSLTRLDSSRARLPGLDRALKIVHGNDLEVNAGRIRRGLIEKGLELALREVECDLRVRGDLPKGALQFVGLDADGRFDVGHLASVKL